MAQRLYGGGGSSLFSVLADVICSATDRKVTENHTEGEDSAGVGAGGGVFCANAQLQ